MIMLPTRINSIIFLLLQVDPNAQQVEVLMFKHNTTQLLAGDCGGMPRGVLFSSMALSCLVQSTTTNDKWVS